MTAALMILAIALLLAYANGANDNFKGVATLHGSHTLNYRSALGLATVSTGLGSVVSLLLAQGLLKAFSGKGLVPDEIAAAPEFLGAVGLGAGVTVLLAALVGIPISTTHALTGALVGAGLVQASGALDLSVLGSKFAIPLLVSPLLALIATALLYPPLRWLRRRLGVERETCLLVEVDEELVVAPVEGAIEPGAVVVAKLSGQRSLHVTVGEQPRVVERYRGRVAGVSAAAALDGAHVLSAGAVGFARGLNDTPKIAALLVAAPAFGGTLGTALIGVAMAVGGLLNARKVAETMSHKITTMNAGQGFTGNVVSALLVTVASRFGVPVSTTHVTCGSLFGIGLATGEARWKTIGGIAFAWVATLPAAFALAALASLALR